jgi:hypothetical protein
VGSNPTWGIDVWCARVRLFCVSVVMCIGRGLATADHSSKESNRLCLEPMKNENPQHRKSTV